MSRVPVLPFSLLALSACIADDQPPEVDTTTQAASAPSGGWRWADGEVRYHLSSAIKNDPATQAKFDQVVAVFEAATSLVFIEQPTSQLDQMTVEYEVDFSCSSTGQTTGRAGGLPGALVAMCDASVGTWIHETGHALGMNHEQQRPDRELHVHCRDECFDIGVEADHLCSTDGNFMKDPAPAQVFGLYDKRALLHYSSYIHANAFCSPLFDLGDTTDTDGDPVGFVDRNYSLSMSDINALRQMYQMPLDADDPGSDYGETMVAGDFDDDGKMDIAIGAPGAHNGTDVVGAVFVYKGTRGRGWATSSGVSFDWGSQLVPWHKIIPAQFDKSGQDGEEFGAALRAGDLNDDGVTDLVIGAPGRNSNKGAVYVMYGHAYERPTQGDSVPPPVFGLAPADDPDDAYFTAVTIGAVTTANSGDDFGRALAIGDTDDDGVNQLAIGMPGRDSNKGKVVVLELGGAPSVLAASSPLQGDQFGKDIAIADLDGDDREDIMVGAPQGESTAATAGGKLVVFLSKTTGFTQIQSTSLINPVAGDLFGQELEIGKYLDGTTKQLAVGAPGRDGFGRIILFKWVAGTTNKLQSVQSITQATIGFTSASGDRFGEHMRSAFLHGDQHEDLIVGVPRKDVSGTDAGAFYVMRADATGFTSAIRHLPPNPVTDGRYGSTVISGDLDEDDDDDVVVGEKNARKAYSFEGSSSGLTGDWQGHWADRQTIIP